MEMDSDLAAEQISDESLDLVFLDAHLDVKQLDKDLHVWYKKVRSGGLFAIHDTHVGVVHNSVKNFINLNKISSKISNFDNTLVWCK